jgi:hypothetical protein
MLISTTELITQSWKIYFKNFKTLISFIGIQILLVVVAFGVPGGLFYLASKTSSVFLMILGVITYVLGICASVYGGLWINVATSKAAKNAIENKVMSISDVFKKTRTLILPTFGTTLLKVALVYLGLIAFIIPGIILLVTYAFAETAVVYDEPKEGAAAIRMSKDLVFGRWWRMLGRWLAAYLLPILVVSIIAYLFSLSFKGSIVSAATEQSVPMVASDSDIPPYDLNDFNLNDDDFSQFDSYMNSRQSLHRKLSISPRFVAYFGSFSILSVLLAPYFTVVAGLLYTSAKANQMKKV